MALKRRCPNACLLHHSDQGFTYASEDYQTILEARGITCSMSRCGYGYDDAVIESFFSSVKSEDGERFGSFGEAKMALFDYIEVFYNQRRRHSTLKQISPVALERRPRWRDGGALVGSHRAGSDDDGHAAKRPSTFYDDRKKNRAPTSNVDRLNQPAHQIGSDPHLRDWPGTDSTLHDLPVAP